MKSAMTEMIEWLESYEYEIPLQLQVKAKELLEKEKEQLNISFISGAIEALSSSTPVRDRIKDGYFENKAEQYFEYTYKTNKL